jgi:hypothetical protein
MKIVHRVSFNPDDTQRNTLLQFGITLNEHSSPYVSFTSFEIDEGHECWPKIQSLIAEWKTVDFVRTEFSSAETDSATLLSMNAWLHKYPEPRVKHGFYGGTYDGLGCSICGVGSKQVRPFQISGEPKWGKRQILQLNWVYDEVFVQPCIWEALFKPLEIGYNDVLHHRTGEPLKTVVQLQINTISPHPLNINGYVFDTCATCNQIKYLPITRGCFPSFRKPPDGLHIFKTQEVFGSGASAWRAIVISNEVYLSMKRLKMTGIEVVPFES